MTNKDQRQAVSVEGAEQYGTPRHARPWLSNDGLAERWDVSVETVRKWRKEGTGPAGVKLGRHIRYPIAEVERWEREQAAKQVRASA